MSDVSVLSHEYKTASELSQAINHALITLKKVHLGLPGADALAAEEVAHSRRNLAAILSALSALLASGAPPKKDAKAAARVPGVLIARIRAQRRGDLDYYLEDLRELSAKLATTSPRLAKKDLALLDDLAAAADAETSSVFRRLMRT